MNASTSSSPGGSSELLRPVEEMGWSGTGTVGCSQAGAGDAVGCHVCGSEHQRRHPLARLRITGQSVRLPNETQKRVEPVVTRFELPVVEIAHAPSAPCPSPRAGEPPSAATASLVSSPGSRILPARRWNAARGEHHHENERAEDDVGRVDERDEEIERGDGVPNTQSAPIPPPATLGLTRYSDS